MNDFGRDVVPAVTSRPNIENERMEQDLASSRLFFVKNVTW